MSRWKLRIEERAEADAREAFLWYRARNPVAAEFFQAAVEECIDRIAAEPENFPLIDGTSVGDWSSTGFRMRSCFASLETRSRLLRSHIFGVGRDIGSAEIPSVSRSLS